MSRGRYDSSYEEDTQDGNQYEYEDEAVEMNPVLSTRPSEHEKSTCFRSSMDMRNDASFCDVAFLVQGRLFRAHKIIVRFDHALLLSWLLLM